MGPDDDDDQTDDERSEDESWGESFMNDMEEVNPDWVSGDESDQQLKRFDIQQDGGDRMGPEEDFVEEAMESFDEVYDEICDEDSDDDSD